MKHGLYRTIFQLMVFFTIANCNLQKNEKSTATASKEKIIFSIDSIGQSFINGGKVLGFTIAVIQKNDTLYNKSFGYVDIARTKAVKQQQVFNLASISKLVGGIVVMKLVEEGKLSLDQTLFELLPDFPNAKQAKKIQIKHLLSHTSGLPEYSAYIDTIYKKTNVAPVKKDFYNFFGSHKLYFEPGSDYSYCNSGFLLMAMIVERITGHSWQQEVDRVVNQPTGMHLQLMSEAVYNPDLCPYFELQDDEFVRQPNWTWFKGDGGLTTTALELANLPFYLSSGRIISKQSWKQMCKPFILNDGIVTGYGIAVRNGVFEGDKVLGHTGGTISPISIMTWFPESETSIVVMVNTDNTPHNVRRILGPVAQVVLKKKLPAYTKKEVPDSLLTKYEGVYYFTGHKAVSKVYIRLHDNNRHLYYHEGINEPGKQMINLGKGEFWIPEWPYDRLIFVTKKDGEVHALKEYYTGFYVLLRKKI